MSDIVGRIRDVIRSQRPVDPTVRWLLIDAKDRITELEAKNARLRVAVAAFLDAESTLWCCAECMTAAPHLADLRRALEDDR